MLLGQAPDLRQAIGADADHAAPLVVDADADQLREHLEHLRLHVGGNVFRVAARIVAGAAEQQTAVGREAEVVERHALVADCRILRQQFAAQRFGQALGGDDVTAGRQHLAGELRLQAVEVGVAGEHQGFCLYHAIGRVDLDLRAILDAFDLRLLEQAYAQRLRRGRLAKRQIQRVQVPGAHIQQAAEVTL